MRRRAKPAKAKVETRRPVARKSPKNEASGRRELEKRLVEAQEQQTATAEILRVISSSGPVTEVHRAPRRPDLVESEVGKGSTFRFTLLST